MKIVVVFILIAFPIFLRAQNNNNSWVRAFGGVNTDIGNSVVTDDQGNVYVSGLFKGTVDFDPSQNTNIEISTSSASDLFIAKYNSFGNLIWVRTIGGSGTPTNVSSGGITLDQTGSLIVSGGFTGNVDFDPGLSTFNLVSNTLAGQTAPDIFVLKIDSNGNFIWAKKFGSTGMDAGGQVTTDVNNNIICKGIILEPFRVNDVIDCLGPSKPFLAKHAIDPKNKNKIILGNPYFIRVGRGLYKINPKFKTCP